MGPVEIGFLLAAALIAAAVVLFIRRRFRSFPYWAAVLTFTSVTVVVAPLLLFAALRLGELGDNSDSGTLETEATPEAAQGTSQ